MSGRPLTERIVELREHIDDPEPFMTMQQAILLVAVAEAVEHELSDLRSRLDSIDEWRGLS